MKSKFTTEDVREVVEGMDLLSLGLVLRRHIYHWDRVAVLTNADGSHNSFFGRIRTGLSRVMSVDECFEVWVNRNGGCSDNNCKSDS